MAQSLAELLASARGLPAALKLKTSALDAAVTDLQSWQSEAPAPSNWLTGHSLKNGSSSE